MKKIICIAISIILVIVIGYSIFNYQMVKMGSGLKSLSATVDLDPITKAKVEISMGIGQVYVSDGTEQFMDGKFLYENNMIAPIIQYEQKDESGFLNISQKQRSRLFYFNFFGAKDNQNEYRIQLNDQVPLDLLLKTGVGKNELNLKNLNLTNLVIEAGVGETIIDLNGAWHTSFDVDISTGIGKTKVILPDNIGVKLISTKGIGSLSIDGFSKEGNDYFNQAYESSDIRMNITLDMGIGEVIILTEAVTLDVSIQ